jgi:hypothetical protein
MDQICGMAARHLLSTHTYLGETALSTATTPRCHAFDSIPKPWANLGSVDGVKEIDLQACDWLISATIVLVHLKTPVYPCSFLHPLHHYSQRVQSLAHGPHQSSISISLLLSHNLIDLDIESIGATRSY